MARHYGSRTSLQPKGIIQGQRWAKRQAMKFLTTRSGKKPTVKKTNTRKKLRAQKRGGIRK